MKKVRWEFVIKSNITKGNLASKYPTLKSYDIALPQQWLNQAAKKLSQSPDSGLTESEAYDKLLFGTVWNYPDKSIFGEPFYLYQELEEVMCEL